MKPDIARYRSSHVIDAIPAGDGYGLVCAHCGFTVHRIKGGHRHDLAQISIAARQHAGRVPILA